MFKRVLIAFLFALLPLTSFAQSMTDQELFNVMRESAGEKVSDQEIENIITTLANQGAKVEGIASFSAWDASFFVDTDTHDISVTYVDGQTGQLTTDDTSFEVKVKEGGLVVGLTYKYNWIFFLSPVSLGTLNGLKIGGPLFGRGIGGSLSPGLVAGTVNAVNGKGMTVVMASVGIGLAEEGIRFPRLEFSLREGVEALQGGELSNENQPVDPRVGTNRM